MNNRINIQEELKSINSSLPPSLAMAPFFVPQDYFEGLAADVLLKINVTDSITAKEEISQLSPLLAGISRKTPFSIPDNYFDSPIDLKITEADIASPVLAEAGKGMPYDVPAGYFDKLPSRILGSVQPQARVIPMNARNWMRMAAAAVIAGVITISSVVYFSTKQEIAVDSPQWVAKKLKNVSDRELEEFVKTADITYASSSVSKNSATRSGDVKRILKDVPDNELDAFLRQLPSDSEELILN